MPVRIAIDGFSSCGKSTVAKALAKELGYTYIDTGAMYRAVTLYFLRNQILLHEEKKVEKALQAITITFSNEGKEVWLNGENVSDEIRQMPVAENVSKISALKAVREAMVAQQRLIGQSQNVVMDGRDIGTAVFPNAELKIFMTADPEIRAQRRFKELLAKGEKISFEEILVNVTQRDHDDTTRVQSPLVQANDAITLDNSVLNEQQQLDFIKKLLPLNK